MLEGKSVSELKKKRDGFLYSSTHIVGLGMKGSFFFLLISNCEYFCLISDFFTFLNFYFIGEPPEELKGKCWMYFPEDDCPFYRATLFSHYSPKNVPEENTWSLMFEFSESTCKPPPADAIEATIQGALNTKVDFFLSKLTHFVLILICFIPIFFF